MGKYFSRPQFFFSVLPSKKRCRTQTIKFSYNLYKSSQIHRPKEKELIYHFGLSQYILNKIFNLSLSLMMMTAVRMVTRLRVIRVMMPRMSRASDLVIMTSAASRLGHGSSS